jgi:hypothetical protein
LLYSVGIGGNYPREVFSYLGVQLNGFNVSLELEYIHALQDQLSNIDLLMHVEHDVFLFYLGEIQNVINEEEHQV